MKHLVKQSNLKMIRLFFCVKRQSVVCQMSYDSCYMSVVVCHLKVLPSNFRRFGTSTDNFFFNKLTYLCFLKILPDKLSRFRNLSGQRIFFNKIYCRIASSVIKSIAQFHCVQLVITSKQAVKVFNFYTFFFVKCKKSIKNQYNLFYTIQLFHW